MKKIIDKYRGLSVVRKIEAVIAMLLSLAVVIATPALAWFSANSSYEIMTEIQKPINLEIRAGHADPVEYFNLRDIDIDSGSPKYYVFSISTGNYNINYKIQFAHTTNIPFTYKIYKATQSTETPSGTYVVYNSFDTNTYYYSFETETEVNLTPLNRMESDAEYGRKIAIQNQNNQYYSGTYNDGDKPQIYAVPVYYISDEIRRLADERGYDYYILEISWDNNYTDTGAYKEWNIVKNNKETDIVYISAKQV